MHRIILAVLLLICTFSRAQEEEESFYDPDEPDYKAVLKIEPVQAINGHFPVYLEVFVSKKFTIELGIAATQLDFLYEADILEDPFDATQENRRGKLGYGFSGSIRYYASDYSAAFDEWYLEAGIRSRQYYSKVRDCSDNSNRWLNESRFVNEFRLLLGYSLQIGDNLILDCYAGSGLRSQYLDRQVCIQDFTFSGLSSDPLNGLRVRPALFMGFKAAIAL